MQEPEYSEFFGRDSEQKLFGNGTTRRHSKSYANATEYLIHPHEKRTSDMKGKPTSKTIIYKHPFLSGNPTMMTDSDSVTLNISFTSDLPNGIYKYVFDLYFSATKSIKVFLYGECRGVGYKANTIYED